MVIFKIKYLKKIVFCNMISFLYFSSIFFLLLLLKQTSCQVESCDINDINCRYLDSNLHSTDQKLKRYLLYDVNPGEGFNLRRDVYMRIATLVKKLNDINKESEWNLVLPPWGPLYHWKTKDIGYQGQLEWSRFFDLSSLKKYVPVIELHEFFNEHGPVIDSLYYLQHYAEGWSGGVWEERANIRDCNDPPLYSAIKSGGFRGWFWGFDQIFAKHFHCLSIQGYSSTLKNFLLHSTDITIMIDRAEIILHDNFGDSEYWMVRRSMVFSSKLISIADEYRQIHLNSTDDQDNTKKNLNSLNSPTKRSALGGPYIAVHLRRRDFVKARPKDVPSIMFTAQQIQKKMKDLNLKQVFIASDATKSEFQELSKYIPEVKRFVPNKKILNDVLDGGVAIIDQWICAHSRYFLGTYESTFSFRIQEEREIMGFPIETTFNRLCGDNQTKCTQPSKWKIVF